MIALDRQKMGMITLLTMPISLLVIIAPFIGLALLGGPPIPRLHQFVAIGFGACCAFTLSFGVMCLEASYTETNLVAIRRRQRGLIGGWAYIMVFVIGICWQVYQVG